MKEIKIGGFADLANVEVVVQDDQPEHKELNEALTDQQGMTSSKEELTPLSDDKFCVKGDRGWEISAEGNREFKKALERQLAVDTQLVYTYGKEFNAVITELNHNQRKTTYIDKKLGNDIVAILTQQA